MKRDLLFPMFIHSAKGGMQQIVIDLIIGLNKLKWNCTFITYSGTELYEELIKRQINVIGIKPPKNILYFPIFILKLYFIIFSHKTASIIINDIYTHILLSIYPYIKKEIFVSHGGDYKSTGNEFAAKSGISAKIARFSFKRVKTFVAVSDTQKEALHNNAKVPLRKIYVIYNGFNDKSIVHFNNSEDPIKISVIGYIKRLKNQHILLRTIKNLVNEGHNCILNIFGSIAEQEYYNYMLKCITELGIQDRIFFKGYIVDKNYIYNNSNIIVSCSFHEGFGLSIIEAMAYHIPTIAFAKSAGPASIISNGVTGLLVDNNTSEDYQQAILKYISNNTFTTNIINNAYSLYKKKYSSDAMIKNYNELLQNI